MGERIQAMQQSHNQVHVLKSWPEYWESVDSERKTCELRKDDRGGFHEGDVLFLVEWDPDTKRYTGRRCGRVITHVLPGGQFGLAKGYACLSLST